MATNLITTGFNPKTLIIFDYSGTLSISMAQFSETTRLIRTLNKSGLAKYKINSPEVYWEEIVWKTWGHASITSKHYSQYIFEQLLRLNYNSNQNYINQLEISAKNFVNSYLSFAKIENKWKMLLQKLANTPEIILLIATDNYFEFSKKIISEFENIQLPATCISNDFNFSKIKYKQILIANSAEIGYTKSQFKFWMFIKNKISEIYDLANLQNILLIDDFGENENSADVYLNKSHKSDLDNIIYKNLLISFNLQSNFFYFYLNNSVKSNNRKNHLHQLITRCQNFIYSAL